MQGPYINTQRFNQNLHSELRPDEVFYTNIEKGKELRKLDLTNRRVGRIAYDWKGNILPSCVPIFEKVKNSE